MRTSILSFGCLCLLAVAGHAWAADSDLDPKRLAELQALGKKDDAPSHAVLLALVADSQADYNERDVALRLLTQTKAGGMALLKLADDGKLPEELRAPASFALAINPDAEVKTLADQKLPVPKTKDKQPLPPISKMIEMSGDATAGALVFRNPNGPNCVNCHQIGSEGKLVGPPLDTIGDKLNKAGFYEAILTPSAQIEMSYEGWTIKTKSGDVKVGIIVQDDDDVLTIKNTNGEFESIPAKEVAKKVKQKLSLMPEGLTSTMTLQDLVNLVEFLTKQKPQ